MIVDTVDVVFLAVTLMVVVAVNAVTLWRINRVQAHLAALTDALLKLFDATEESRGC